MNKIAIKQVDAFTSVPFGGNPAGVVTNANGLDDEVMQKIAREMNLSETAFVSKSDVADFKVQFFTPRFEVDLCGHATIATFSSLYEEFLLDRNKTVFYQETKAGVLPVELLINNGKTVFMMTQAPPKFEELEIGKEEIANILGISRADLMNLPLMKVSTGLWWLVVPIKSLDIIRNIKPNQKSIEEISKKSGLVGITPFCLDTLDSAYSYHIRAFAPIAGVSEDPVCGTGNGSVASYIAYHKLIDFKDSINLIGEEGMEVGRPGCVYIQIERDKDMISKVKAGGTAVTVLEGQIKY